MSVSFEYRDGRTMAIGGDSDPAAVRELRDTCIRWLDDLAAAEAAALARIFSACAADGRPPDA